MFFYSPLYSFLSIHITTWKFNKTLCCIKMCFFDICNNTVQVWPLSSVYSAEWKAAKLELFNANIRETHNISIQYKVLLFKWKCTKEHCNSYHLTIYLRFDCSSLVCHFNIRYIILHLTVVSPHFVTGIQWSICFTWTHHFWMGFQNFLSGIK